MAILLFEVGPRDPFVPGASAAAIAVIALAAALVPARQGCPGPPVGDAPGRVI